MSLKTTNHNDRTLRVILSVLLALHALALLGLSLKFIFFSLMAGAIAPVTNLGNEIVDWITDTWWALGFVMMIPITIAALLSVATVQVYKGQRPKFVIVACGLFIMIYLLTSIIFTSGLAKLFTFSAAQPILVPATVIIISFNKIKQQSRKSNL